MPEKIIHFIKYNNATVVILAVILVLGGGAFAAGPEGIGEKQTSIQGLDNSALLAADLNNFSMDFKINKIEADDKYYYVNYSFMDLGVKDQSWQYLISEKTRKISKKIKIDLGAYLAKDLEKHYEARIRELKAEKSRAEINGATQRLEVTEYSGLLGRTLDLASKVFPGYEPVKKVELASPDFSSLPPPNPPLEGGLNSILPGVAPAADNLTRIYNDYVAEHPEIFEAIDNGLADSGLAAASSTPLETGTPAPDPGETTTSDDAASDNTASPGQAPAETEIQPDAPVAEPESVEIIEAPAAPLEQAEQASEPSAEETSQ